MEEEGSFKKWSWSNWIFLCRRMQIGPYLSPFTKLQSKWIKGLNINPQTLNLVENKMGKSLDHIGTGDNVLNRTGIVQALRPAVYNGDFRKVTNFCKAKEPVTQKW